MEAIKPGDEIKVIDEGKVYSLYEDFINKYGAKFKNRWARGYGPRCGDAGKVLVLGKHLDNGKKIAIVESGECIYLIGVIGIERVGEPKN